MTSAPDRHLLFGLLALQNGIIDQGRLVAAFQAWTLDKSRSLADHLEARGDLSLAKRRLLEALAEVHLEAHGDVEKSLAAVSIGASTRERLARIADPDLDATLGHVGPAIGSTDVDDVDDVDRTTSYAVGSSTSDGQRFRVLRPHARGGLGAVFVALDGELNREVALKQILDHHADDPTSRQRFLLEAEITGGLEHPGIVPVYGLGTYGDGRPYYAMRFIRGDSLKEAIAQFHADAGLKADPGRRSLALRKLLRRFGDVCNTIDYAHSRGILHRDLKPDNIIVGKHGETLVVDWGLAKAMGREQSGTIHDERTLVPSSSGGSFETLPGSALGTPAFMSPEQAAGDLDLVGPRSDVYSLGTTLYCLLTGRPPFDGRDLGAILRAVQKGEFPAPRAVDPSIDPALESVCLKAMATAPDERYATPRCLGEDVERWSADEPVSARPEPFAERVRRWMRRRRTAVAASAAALIATTVGLASVLAVQAKSNRDLTKANGQIQARFDLALEAIKTFHTGVTEDVLLENDSLRPVRDRLLKDAIEFYKRLEAQLSGQADRGSRQALGQAYSAMAHLADQIGATELAIAGLRQAIAVRQGLAAGAEADAEATAEVGRSLLNLGSLLMRSGQRDEARISYAKARSLFEDLCRANPTVLEFQRGLAGSYYNTGIMLHETGQVKEAFQAFEVARTILQRLADDDPSTTRYQLDLAANYNATGRLQRATGRSVESLESHKAARTILQRIVDINPTIAEYQEELAISHGNVGSALDSINRPGEALASYKAARIIEQRLADAKPAVTLSQASLASSHEHIGLSLRAIGRLDEALRAHEAARVIRQKLADANPAITRFQRELALSHNNIGQMLKLTGKSKPALASYEAARAIQQKLADANPAVIQFQGDLARSHTNIGQVLDQSGKPREARTSFEEARAIQRKLADANPAVIQFQGDLAGSHIDIGKVLYQSGELGEALASFEEARAIQRKLADAHPAVTELQHTLALIHTNIGAVLTRKGGQADALASYRAGREILRALIEANPATTGLQSDLALNLQNTGSILKQIGEMEEALASLKEARAIQRKLADANPTIDGYQNRLANSEITIGITLKEAGKSEEAVVSFRAALVVSQRLADAHPNIPGYQIQLANTHLETGDVLRLSGQTAEAGASYEKALEIIEKVIKDQPALANLTVVYSVFGLKGLGIVQQAADRTAAAVVSWRRAIAIGERLPTPSNEILYLLACTHARLGNIASTAGSGLSTAEGASALDEAMVVLSRAVDAGYGNLIWIRRDPDLDPLRGRPDFEALIADLAFPSEPFAKATDPHR